VGHHGHAGNIESPHRIEAVDVCEINLDYLDLGFGGEMLLRSGSSGTTIEVTLPLNDAESTTHA
jgi:hypothetical protein